MIEGKVRPEQVSLAKMNNVSLALRIGLQACDVWGSKGIADEYPISGPARPR